MGGRKRSKKIKQKDVISIYIGQGLSDELLEWMNSQAIVSKSIVDVLERYVAGDFKLALIPTSAYKREDEEVYRTKPRENEYGHNKTVEDKEYKNSDNISNSKDTRTTNENVNAHQKENSDDNNEADKGRLNPEDIVIEDENPLESLKKGQSQKPMDSDMKRPSIKHSFSTYE